jgi:hypothetical protein
MRMKFILCCYNRPGVLSGEKQRIGRVYDFPQVIEWFAERADRYIPRRLVRFSSNMELSFLFGLCCCVQYIVII